MGSPGLKGLMDGFLQGHAAARGQALDAAQLRLGQSDGKYSNLIACWHACILAQIPPSQRSLGGVAGAANPQDSPIDVSLLCDRPHRQGVALGSPYSRGEKCPHFMGLMTLFTHYAKSAYPGSCWTRLPQLQRSFSKQP